MLLSIIQSTKTNLTAMGLSDFDIFLGKIWIKKIIDKFPHWVFYIYENPYWIE